METPRTQYANTADGVSLAYQVVGDGPLDLAYMTGWSHLEFRWENPENAHFLNRLAAFSRLIIFDRRGTGQSDPLPTERGLSWEEWMGDLSFVLDKVGSARTALLAFGEGGCMATLFAATYPERTAALALMNFAPRYLQAEGYPWGANPEHKEMMLDMWEQTWGTGQSPLLMTSQVDDQIRQWWGKYERMCANPSRARRFIELMYAGDVRDVLPLVQCPTLLTAREGSIRDIAKYVASQIPDAKYVEVPGPEALPFLGDADTLLDEIEEFLTGVRPVHESDRALATVMFTDIVDSTRRAGELGDKKWTELLDRHDAIVTQQVESHRGRVVKHTGDGVLAIFDGPARGVLCAQAVCRIVRSLGVEVRAGLHTGEIELRGDDIGGIAVHIGQRISAIAGAGQVLVSRTLTDLVAGSGLEFEECGEYELKGVPGKTVVYRVVL